jgi:diguanylate cyclase (GGDEF)-like protein/PAS domain S-box-containing protein
VPTRTLPIPNNMLRDILHAFSRHGVLLIFALAVTGLIARSWISYRVTTDGLQQAEAAYYARSEVLDVLTDLLNQETGLRGYVSTKQRSYLDPYVVGQSRIDPDIRLALRASATASASSIDPLILSAATLYREWDQRIARPLIARPDRRDAAVLQARGKALMDLMRADVAHARDVLDAKTASYSMRTREQLALGAVVSFVIGFALCSAIVIMFGVQRRIEGERDRFVTSAQDMFVVAGLDGFFVDVNPAAERILSRTRAQLLAEPFMSLVHPDDLERSAEAASRLRSGLSVEGFRNRYRAADGTYRWICWNAVPDLRRHQFYASGRDETDRVAFELERDHLAFNDVVTGLPNRASFLAHTARALFAARTNKTELVIVLFDLDGFKAVNDAHGHSAGDDVLRELAKRVRSALRETDLLARIGGDEFTILLQAQVGSLDVGTVIRKIEDTFREPLGIQGHALHVSASIGVARYPIDGDTVDGLLASADYAMYRAKRLAGHNTG